MPRGSDRAAARPFLFLILRCAAPPFLFLILRCAAPPEASSKFTRDRRSRAKEFSALQLHRWNTLSSTRRERRALAIVRQAEPPTALPVRGAVVSNSVRLRSTTGLWRLVVAQSISFQPVYSRRALPLSLRKEHRLWQWCVCCG